MNYQSIIEDYFLGKIEGDDLIKFKSDLNSNNEFRSEFETYKRAIEYVLAQEKNVLLISGKLMEFDLNVSHLQDVLKYKTVKSPEEDEQKLIEILNSESKELERSIKFRSVFLKFLKGAAVLIFVLGLSFTGYNVILKVTNSNEDTFDKFYESYPYSIITRSGAYSVSGKIDKGLLYYSLRDYQNSVTELSLIPDSLKDGEVLLIEGSSLIELGRYREAICRFDLISKESLVYSTALWYSGLCHLRLNDIASAKKSFQKIQSIEPYYQKRSKQLLRYI